MNRIIGIIVFVLFIGNTYAQSISQSNIPAVVLNVFQLKYPNAADIDWKLEKGNYQVDYKVNNKVNELTMDFKGNLLKHSQDLYTSEIPKAVLETIRDRVAYFDIHDADKYEEGGTITYEIRFKMDGKNHYFWVNEKGKLIKYRKELKDNEIPSSIINMIKEKYGSLDIDRTRYVEENGKIVYIIEGEINDRDHVFTVDNKETVLKHEQDLRDNEIPAPILSSIKKSYNGYDIRDADLIEEGGKSSYMLRMRKSKGQVYVTFNQNGKILETK